MISLSLKDIPSSKPYGREGEQGRTSARFCGVDLPVRELALLAGVVGAP